MTNEAPTWRPRAAVTGVGSLPIGEPERAVAFVAAHAPEVPFWPQLPQRSASEGMVLQALGVDRSLLTADADGRLAVVEGAEQTFADQLLDRDPALRPDEAAGFAAFVRAVRRGDLRSAIALKGQVAGPLTVGWALSAGGRPVSTHPELFTAVVHRIAARAAWQATVLAAAGLPVLISVDEPVLGLVEPEGGDPLDVVYAAIRAAGGLAGLHSCATVTADLPVGAAADVVGLDLRTRASGLPAAARRAWAGGAVLAAGLVPTVSDPAALPAVADVVTAWQAAAAATGDLAQLADRTLLTATCGLAGVGEDAAGASFRLAAAAGRQIRTLAEGAPAGARRR